MIAPLRRRHRATFLVLGVALPVLFVGALVVREDPPTQDELPAELTAGRVPIAEQPPDPDPLLYWSAETPVVGESLPKGARFLGALRSGQWLDARGPTAPAGQGSFFVYSLIDQRVTRLVPESELRREQR